MTSLTKTYPNGHIRTMTVLSVAYGEDPDTAILETAEDGAVSISLADDPALWAQLPPPEGG